MYRFRQRILARQIGIAGFRCFGSELSQTPLEQWTIASRAYRVTFRKLLPQLSQTGTLFLESLATVEDRQRQFESLLTALFHPEVPEDFRTSWAVHHFFSYWSMDYNREQQCASRIVDINPSMPSQATTAPTISSGFRFHPPAVLPAFSRDWRAEKYTSNDVSEGSYPGAPMPNRHGMLSCFIFWMGRLTAS